MQGSREDLLGGIDQQLRPLRGRNADYDPLLDLIGDRDFVLLGEASHGTHEFYLERARITRRLIEEKGFTTVAIEADWPDAYRINRYVRWMSDDASAEEALGGFKRFPLWMWRNTAVADFTGWLRDYNAGRVPGRDAVSFYGLDLYSLHASAEAVLRYLEEVDPDGARRARARYSCFDHVGVDSQAYGYAAGLGLTPSCENEAVEQLVEMRRRAGELASLNGRIPEDEYFFAEQNARLVKNAEEYYRTMFRGRASSWNLRDRHMFETVEAIRQHLETKGGTTRIVVWAHNSHLGDARATEMVERGELNLGQLVRQNFGDRSLLVGFTTATGTVTAASDWNAPAERYRIREPIPGSFEEVFRQVGEPAFFLSLIGDSPVAEALRIPRLERAIGVIYRPETERASHYFHARLSDQFDAVLHFDETTALEPLDRVPGWPDVDAPETYPFDV
jgi:erythromycin esterase-like protein